MSSVTVVIPAWNRADMILDALDSLRRQTVTDWRCIVADDASDDGTADVASSFGDARVEVVRFSTHVGMTANVNRAVGCVESGRICFLGSDDVYHPEKLERQLALHADCTFTGITFASDGSNRWRHACAGKLVGGTHVPVVERYSSDFATFQGNVATGTAMLNVRQWIPWHENIVTGGADMLWVYEMWCSGYRFEVEPNALYCCRRHEGRQLYRRRAMDQSEVRRELDEEYWPLVREIGARCSR